MAASPGFTINSPIDIRLPIEPEVDDPVLKTELAKVYNAIRNLQVATTTLTGAQQRDPSIWNLLQPTDTIKSQNLNRYYAKAQEAIAFGAVINVVDLGGGIAGIRLANAASADKRPCHGFCDTSGGIAAGDYGEVILMHGLCAAIGGLTIGTTYYLNTTAPGTVTNILPAGPNLQQSLGFALGPQLLYFATNMP